MKRYQIALLFFSFGIFAVTSFGVYFVKSISDRNVVIRETPMAREYKTIRVFFSNNIKDKEMIDCSRVYPAERAVSRLSDNTKSGLAEYSYLAITELLRGPAQYEKENGYLTSINEGTKVQKIAIEQGVAKIDFNDVLEQNVGGSCKILAIRSQIAETLKQFPEIKEVIISVNGNSETALQP